MKKLVLVLAVMLTACNSPKESGVMVIVGARLIPGAGAAPVEHSVVVIEGGKFREVGPQSSTPVPKGAEMVQGTGMTVNPSEGGETIAPGQPANLMLSGPPVRVMKNGAWVN